MIKTTLGPPVLGADHAQLWHGCEVFLIQWGQSADSASLSITYHQPANGPPLNSGLTNIHEFCPWYDNGVKEDDPGTARKWNVADLGLLETMSKSVRGKLDEADRNTSRFLVIPIIPPS